MPNVPAIKAHAADINKEFRNDDQISLLCKIPTEVVIELSVISFVVQ